MSISLNPKTTHDATCCRTTTALRIVVGISLLAACVMVLAQSPAEETPAVTPADLSVEQLESAFWACDHAATTRRVDGAEGMACSETTDTLKARKFNGSFEALLDWWRDNKGSAFLAIDQAAESVTTAEAFPEP